MWYGTIYTTQNKTEHFNNFHVLGNAKHLQKSTPNLVYMLETLSFESNDFEILGLTHNQIKK